MTDSKLIDSSIWIEFLFNNQYSEIIKSWDMLLLSSLSLFEIKRKLQQEKIEPQKIQTSIEYIKQRSLIIFVSSEIAENAAQLSFKHKLAAMDAIIYATAKMKGAHLITRDNDFRGLPNTTILS